MGGSGGGDEWGGRGLSAARVGSLAAGRPAGFFAHGIRVMQIGGESGGGRGPRWCGVGANANLACTSIYTSDPRVDPLEVAG